MVWRAWRGLRGVSSGVDGRGAVAGSCWFAIGAVEKWGFRWSFRWRRRRTGNLIEKLQFDLDRNFLRSPIDEREGQENIEERLTWFHPFPGDIRPLLLYTGPALIVKILLPSSRRAESSTEFGVEICKQGATGESVPHPRTIPHQRMRYLSHGARVTQSWPHFEKCRRPKRITNCCRPHSDQGLLRSKVSPSDGDRRVRPFSHLNASVWRYFHRASPYFR